jgi:hypothetical protein
VLTIAKAPEKARALAAELARCFERDTERTHQLRFLDGERLTGR